MVRLVLAIGFSFLASTSVAQVLGFSLSEGKKRVQIPIEIHNNLVVVPVILNGALPLKFIVDTGVRTAILTEKTYSDILNLAYSRKYTISGPGGERLIDAYVTNNVSLQLPGVDGRGHALLVLAEDYLELRNYLGTDVHGILGYELFSRFVTTIDYERKVLTLSAPTNFRKKRRYDAIPIKIEDTKPFVTTSVVLSDGTQLTAKLLVDTGASHGLLLEPTSHPRIHVPDSVVSSVIGRGLGGEITGKVGRIHSLRMGDYNIPGVIASFPDPNSYFDSLKLSQTQRNGAIGGEVLSRFTVVFNFPKEEMYIRKNAAYKKKFHYNLSGLTVRAKGARLNVFEIMEVRQKSVADRAGVRAGDLIVSVNGINTRSLDLNTILGFFNNKPGKKINLVVNRGGQHLKVQFSLADQI
jgi:predicted aspartyl protease